ncbi:metalloproteinase inhibitor 4-like [Oncorhynchus keta]|uniref:metalloproteinase inhibitor 4-like n=1 Tax=Oncorhynchus keta TaxID=8018 RepID=UPI00227AE334|nr:metalloproteinase inhibitor 4-like [Oncorhynchus keta]
MLPSASSTGFLQCRSWYGNLATFYFSVIRAKVVGKEAVSNAIKYDIQQIKMFKGYDQVIHAIYTYTTSCSVTLEINKEYLFTGGKGSVECDCVICGSVGAVCEM